MKITQQVWEFSEPVVQAHGCSLWDVEYIREGGEWFLRLYIDKEGGVNISDCEAISRAIDPILDEKDPIPDSYSFEVCSAGLERQLKRPSDFERFMGSSVTVRLYTAKDGAKEHTGILTGYDGGAVGRVSGTPEKGLNLDVARRLAAILEAQGAQIVMTRTDDYALCDEHPPIRKKLQDMQRRAAIIEQSGAQMVLSIHMNEYAGRSQSGPQVFYREGCPAGRLLAGAIQEAMNETLAPKKKRSALGGDYYILTLGRPSVLVECGFLSNAGEEALLLTADYRQRVAQAIARGIWAWANLPEEKPEALPAVERGGEAEAET